MANVVVLAIGAKLAADKAAAAAEETQEKKQMRRISRDWRNVERRLRREGVLQRNITGPVSEDEMNSEDDDKNDLHPSRQSATLLKSAIKPVILTDLPAQKTKDYVKLTVDGVTVVLGNRLYGRLGYITNMLELNDTCGWEPGPGEEKFKGVFDIQMQREFCTVADVKNYFTNFKCPPDAEGKRNCRLMSTDCTPGMFHLAMHLLDEDFLQQNTLHYQTVLDQLARQEPVPYIHYQPNEAVLIAPLQQNETAAQEMEKKMKKEMEKEIAELKKERVAQGRQSTARRMQGRRSGERQRLRQDLEAPIKDLSGLALLETKASLKETKKKGHYFGEYEPEPEEPVLEKPKPDEPEPELAAPPAFPSCYYSVSGMITELIFQSLVVYLGPRFTRRILQWLQTTFDGEMQPVRQALLQLENEKAALELCRDASWEDYQQLKKKIVVHQAKQKRTEEVWEENVILFPNQVFQYLLLFAKQPHASVFWEDAYFRQQLYTVIHFDWLSLRNQNGLIKTTTVDDLVTFLQARLHIQPYEAQRLPYQTLVRNVAEDILAKKKHYADDLWGAEQWAGYTAIQHQEYMLAQSKLDRARAAAAPKANPNIALLALRQQQERV